MKQALEKAYERLGVAAALVLKMSATPNNDGPTVYRDYTGAMRLLRDTLQTVIETKGESK